MKKRLAYILFFILGSAMAHGQLKIQMVGSAKPLAYTLGDLFSFSTISTIDQDHVVFSGSIKTNNGQVLVNFKTSPVTLSSGMQMFSEQSLAVNHLSFSGNDLGDALQSNSSLPPGSYIACIEAIKHPSQTTLAVNCREVDVRPITNPRLLVPRDEGKINNTKPGFSWSPATLGNLKFQSGVSYQLKLVEITEGQSPLHAISQGIPVILQKGIKAQFLAYPAAFNELEYGKRYAWRVTAYYLGYEMAGSETFTFTPINTPMVTQHQQDHVLEVNTHSAGPVLRSHGMVKLRLSDYIPTEELTVFVFDSEGKSLTGKNAIDFNAALIELDLSTLKGIKRGNFYKLKIERGNHGHIEQVVYYEPKA